MSIPFNYLNNQLGIADKFTFGKYYMCKVTDVLDSDLGYIAYLLSNTNIQFSDLVMKEAMRCNKRKPRFYYSYHEDDTINEDILDFEDIPY